MEAYSKALLKNGVLNISGFFESDANALIQHAEQFDLQPVKQITRTGWTIIQFQKL